MVVTEPFHKACYEGDMQTLKRLLDGKSSRRVKQFCDTPDEVGQWAISAVPCELLEWGERSLAALPSTVHRTSSWLYMCQLLALVSALAGL